ncbi:MAG TPA: type II secretion system protein [Calditerricola sp.]
MIRSGNERGGILLEWVVALAVLGIVLSVALPAAQGPLAATERRAFLRAVVGDLQRAQSEVFARAEEVAVHVAPTGYAVALASGRRLRERAAPPGIRLASNFPNGVLRFGPDGRIQQGGSIWIEADGTPYARVILQVVSGRVRAELLAP